MMKANYHTHTWRCNHAEPDERAYVQAALDTGLKVLGFSDHSPYPFDDGYCSGFRMRCDQTAEYIRTIAALRDEYRGDIDIHIGFEAEYYPRYFGRLLEMLESTEYEYLILGQHFLGNELDSQPNFEETDDPARLHQYTDQCMEALNTGAFSCFAHPDVMHFVGDETLYRAESRRLCREAKACGVPLEINLLGMGLHRYYPREAFWEEAAAVGNAVILGWDAHRRDWMRQTEQEAAGEALIARLGLHRLDYLTLIRPHPAAHTGT